LPIDGDAWDRGAQIARRLHLDPLGRPSPGADPGRRSEQLAELGAVMATAYGLRADDPVVAWWSTRLPRR
jgi:hypothetical protein